jgi:hypothetical protein
MITLSTLAGSAAVSTPWIFPIHTVRKKWATMFLSQGKTKKQSITTMFFVATVDCSFNGPLRCAEDFGRPGVTKNGVIRYS